MTLSRSNTPVQGSPALVSTGDPTTDPAAAAAEDNMLRVSTVIVNDVKRLRRELRALWDEQIKRTIMNGVDETGEVELEGEFRNTCKYGQYPTYSWIAARRHANSSRLARNDGTRSHKTNPLHPHSTLHGSPQVGQVSRVAISCGATEEQDGCHRSKPFCPQYPSPTKGLLQAWRSWRIAQGAQSRAVDEDCA